MPTRDTGVLTVAAVRKAKREGVTEVVFHERQRIFALPSGSKGRGAAELLGEALRKKLPVKASLDVRRPLVQRIEPASPKEIEEFYRLRIPLDEPEKPFRVNLRTIDPTLFNIVDRYLKVRLFRRCRKIVPNYAKAKQIFDFCAKQSCHLGGPFDITPCIPFQYVIDGCYARAHKMRKIITTKYRYCCEKVFSFATPLPDRLAVKADKWGGCCVTWWYHVAPLIRVRVRGFCTLAMVIDPGMFDKPVLLSTWLSAQENTACHPNARVTKYSIQPGSAYWPTNSSGTTFGTDPNYVLTDGTLNNYKNLTTC